MSRTTTLQHILQRWHTTSPNPHVNKVMLQLKTCRTASQGYHVYQCSNEACGRYHYRYHSCRNRHCPQCGGFQKQEWIEQRTAELLPTPYFHVVFTLPHELNALILGNRQPLFKLLFDASAATLLQFARDDNYLGATPGILSVLHTWGQQLSFHPHVHCIVSSGGITASRSAPQWKTHKRRNGRFLFPVKAISKVFRAKFLQGLKKCKEQGLVVAQSETGYEEMLRKLWLHDWVVYAKKPFGGPQQVIRYLGRYTHKTALTNQRIRHVDEAAQTVSFDYRDYRQEAKQKTMRMRVEEFIRRFEQHILPKGFTRIRSYGYLSNRGRTQRLQQLTTALKIPPHPARVSIPWQLRLWIEGALTEQKCVHCGRFSLQLVRVRFGCDPFNDS